MTQVEVVRKLTEIIKRAGWVDICEGCAEGLGCSQATLDGAIAQMMDTDRFQIKTLSARRLLMPAITE